MFDNQNFFPKQERVNGSGLPVGIVNIDRVDADELDATSDQIAGRILGQVGMVLKVFLGRPVLVPTVGKIINWILRKFADVEHKLYG